MKQMEMERFIGIINLYLDAEDFEPCHGLCLMTEETLEPLKDKCKEGCAFYKDICIVQEFLRCAEEVIE